MNKVQKIAAGLCLAALLAGGALTARLYSERKATEAADAAQRAKWESAEQAAINQAAADQTGQTGPDNPGSSNSPNTPGGRREVDYAFFSTNEFSEQNAFNRPQLFKEKRLLYEGKHYTRHTGIKAILLIGVDRKKEGFKEERLPIDQGQADAVYLAVHNTSRNTVKILQIPRDTQAVMYGTDVNGKDIGMGIANLTMAYNSGDGVTKSCDRMCEAVEKLLGGLKTDHYIAGDANIITDLNDLLGGVTVTVPGEGLEWIDPAFTNGASVTLHGAQAERFVRARDINEDNTAIYRMERHKAFIQGFQRRLKQCLKSDSGIVDKMFDTIEDDMLTDMKRSEYTDLTMSALAGGQDLSDGDFLMLPGKPVVGGQYDQYYPYYADINKMILELFYYPVD